MHGVMRFQKLRIFREYWALRRIVDVLLQLGRTRLPGVAEKLIEHLQVVEVKGLGKGAAGKDPDESLEHLNDRRQRIGNENGSYRSAENDHQFGRLQQHEKL